MASWSSTSMTALKFYRKVIQIRAVDSPNVRLRIAQMRAGLCRPDAAFIRNPLNGHWALWTQEEYDVLMALWQANGSPELEEEIAVPGVLTWSEYKTRRLTWDPIRQAVGLDAIFYTGPQLLLYPPSRLLVSIAIAERLKNMRRVARALGCDPAQGGDKTAWSVVDEFGLIELVSMKTPDTSIIVGTTIALGRKYDIPPDHWVFDRGCGLEHADRIRKMGHRGVRTVGFGEGVILDPKRAKRLYPERMEQREERYSYFKRRDQMYGELSLLVDPSDVGSHLLAKREKGFGIPGPEAGEQYKQLHFQMSKIPKTYNEEGRLKLPPKTRPAGQDKENAVVKTLTELIGHSPDELDSLALACHGMIHKPYITRAGV